MGCSRRGIHRNLIASEHLYDSLKAGVNNDNVLPLSRKVVSDNVDRDRERVLSELNVAIEYNGFVSTRRGYR